MGDIARGDNAVILISAVADAKLDEGDVIVNRASAFYKESVALQAETRLNDEVMAPQSLPETGNSFVIPLAVAAVLLGAIAALRRLRMTAAA